MAEVVSMRAMCAEQESATQYEWINWSTVCMWGFGGDKDTLKD